MAAWMLGFCVYILVDKLVAVMQGVYLDLGVDGGTFLTDCIFPGFDLVRRWPILYVSALVLSAVVYYRYLAPDDNRVKNFCIFMTVVAFFSALALLAAFFAPMRLVRGG
ncbi:MAG: hypothetical protein IT195_13770 [Microthrixaceae bacterium]|nr:hypothetical protein [Microthrixaceae bacterium]